MENVEDSKMSDNEIIVLYTIEHALASETVTMGYLGDELDLPVEELREALKGLVRRNLIVKTRKEYELRA